MTNINADTDKIFFNMWMQNELKHQLEKKYKKIHRIRVFDGTFTIWFLNNEDCVSIPLDVMRSIYDDGKSLERLIRIIDKAYLERIKVTEEIEK